MSLPRNPMGQPAHSKLHSAAETTGQPHWHPVNISQKTTAGLLLSGLPPPLHEQAVGVWGRLQQRSLLAS